MAGPGFAIIDLETTGLFPGGGDRVIEVAVVHADENGTITGEWDTLVNPVRHVGAEHVHRIRAVDLIDAPRFETIAPRLIDLMSGRVLVAHNASFDRRFLETELARARMPLPPAAPVLCTMQLARELIPGAGRSLADCCAAFDIALVGAHRALVDARATAELLGGYRTSTDREFWYRHVDDALSTDWPAVDARLAQGGAWRPRTMEAASVPFLQRIAERMPDHSGPDAHVEYLALLDRCLIDRHLSEHESRQLVALADGWGIGRETAAHLHDEYFDQLVALAWADGALVAAEISDLVAVGQLLQISDARLSAALQSPSPTASSTFAATGALTERAGMPVVIAQLPATGAVVVLTGEMSRPRAELETALGAAGYRVAAAVSRKVDLVVAADPDSLSGKARKARDYGIPVVGEGYLHRMLDSRG